MQLLSSLLDFLFPLREPETLVRLATLESVGTLIRTQVIDTDIVSLLPYRAALVKACITEAKFRNNEKAQTLLALVLAEYLESWTSDRTAFDASLVVLVPVPLSRERQKERGYNQVERITKKALASLPSIQLDTHLLLRTLHTLPQTSLNGGARRRNMEGAFTAMGTPGPAHTYIVVDDVYTTGTTLQAAMHCLKAAGAPKVFGLSLAH